MVILTPVVSAVRTRCRGGVAISACDGKVVDAVAAQASPVQCDFRGGRQVRVQIDCNVGQSYSHMKHLLNL